MSNDVSFLNGHVPIPYFPRSIPVCFKALPVDLYSLSSDASDEFPLNHFFPVEGLGLLKNEPY
jgi:hypothetical protein